MMSHKHKHTQHAQTPKVEALNRNPKPYTVLPRSLLLGNSCSLTRSLCPLQTNTFICTSTYTCFCVIHVCICNRHQPEVVALNRFFSSKSGATGP